MNRVNRDYISNLLYFGAHFVCLSTAFKDEDFAYSIGLFKSSDLMITFNNYSFSIIYLLIVCLISHIISPSKAIDTMPLRDRTKYQKIMIKFGVIGMYFVSLNICWIIGLFLGNSYSFFRDLLGLVL